MIPRRGDWDTRGDDIAMDVVAAHGLSTAEFGEHRRQPPEQLEQLADLVGRSKPEPPERLDASRCLACFGAPAAQPLRPVGTTASRAFAELQERRLTCPPQLVGQRPVAARKLLRQRVCLRERFERDRVGVEPVMREPGVKSLGVVSVGHAQHGAGSVNERWRPTRSEERVAPRQRSGAERAPQGMAHRHDDKTAADPPSPQPNNRSRRRTDSEIEIEIEAEAENDHAADDGLGIAIVLAIGFGLGFT